LVGLLMAVFFYRIYHRFIIPYIGLDRPW
jgi:hypothetical protein